jgi:hypothetical protein
MLPEEISNESGVCLEGTTTRVRMSYCVAESELLMEGTVLRQVQGAMSYKFLAAGL